MNELEQIKRDIEMLKRNQQNGNSFGAQLKYPLDEQSQKIITDYVKDNFFDLFWSTIFSYSTNFDSIDGMTSGGVGGGSVLYSSGVYLSTLAASPSASYIYRTMNSDTFKLFSTETRFRARVQLDTNVDQTFTVYIGSESTSDSYGFIIEDDAVKGFTKVGSTTVSVDLNFSADSSPIVLEAIYNNGERIDFYVNGNNLGSINYNLPQTSSNVLWGSKLTNTSTSASGVYINSIDFIKRRFNNAD